MMKIWDKIVFGSTALSSGGLIAAGVYYCTVAHSPFAAVGLLVGGGAFLSLSCAKLLDKKTAYFECAYQEEEEDFKQAANQLIAYQYEQVHQMRAANKPDKPNILLQMAPAAIPELQIAKDGQSTPKGSPRNPFITNEIFKDNIEIEQLEK